MLCTVEFESIQIMLLTAWCPGHRLGGIGCVQDDSQVDCLSSSCIHGHIVQKQRCSHTSRLNGFFGFVGSVRLVMLRRPHQAAGTEFRTPALCNSLPFLEAHSEGSNSAACKSITAPLKRGKRLLGRREPHLLNRFHSLVPGCPASRPELAPSTDTAIGFGMLVGQNVHSAQSVRRVSSDALRQRLPDGHGSMPAEVITQHHRHVCPFHVLVVLEEEFDLLELAPKVLLLHDSAKQVRVTAGVHAFVVGEGPRQILAAINLIDCLL